MQCFVGVDVSKAKLDVALLLASDKFRSKVFSNNVKGFALLLQWLKDHAAIRWRSCTCAWSPRAATRNSWPAS